MTQDHVRGRRSAMRFAGYAALFDKPDAAQDVIRAGAFRDTLAARTDPLPLFWQHKPDQQIGWVERIEEDERGLRVIASLDNPHGKAAKSLAERTVDGLSFGYRARRFNKNGSGRELRAIDLFEISLVTHPLQHNARVHLIA